MEYNVELGFNLRNLADNATIRGKDTIVHPAVIVGDYQRKEAAVILSRLGGVKEGDSYVFPLHIPIVRLLRTIENTELLPDKDFFDSFSTPAAVAESMWELVSPKMLKDKELRVLEPSAGIGALLLPKKKHRFGTLVAFENHPLRFDYLQHNYNGLPGVKLLEQNFLKIGFIQPHFDLIMANPPQTAPGDKQHYVRHIWMMLELLKKGGQLVCLVPGDLFDSSHKAVVSLRRYLLQRAEYHPVNKDAMRGVPVKEQFSIMVAYKLGGRIHSDNTNTSKHYREALHAVRQRAPRTVEGVHTVNQEP